MNANTKIFGCIADPIDHVKAPTLFTKIFQEQKVNAIMIPINILSLEFCPFQQRVGQNSSLPLNVHG